MSLLVLLMGPPGCGKGTQGRRLAEALSVPYLSSGDLLRRAVAERSPLGEQVRQFIECGAYVPDEVLVPTVTNAVRALLCRTHGVILDGFPRTLSQAEALDAALQSGSLISDAGASSVKPPQVLALVMTASEQTLVARLTGRWTCPNCGRSFHLLTRPPRIVGTCDTCGQTLTQRVDDQLETVQRRLEVYRSTSEPLLAHYRLHGQCLEVDGELSEEEVTVALLAAAEVFGVLEHLDLKGGTVGVPGAFSAHHLPNGAADDAIPYGGVLEQTPLAIAR